VIINLKRVSRPGLRVYADVKHLPRVLRGKGTAIMTTSKGLMTEAKARETGIGGEVLCYVW
jgi:small subunit ribosomal protein S8